MRSADSDIEVMVHQSADGEGPVYLSEDGRGAASDDHSSHASDGTQISKALPDTALPLGLPNSLPSHEGEQAMVDIDAAVEMILAGRRRVPLTKACWWR